MQVWSGQGSARAWPAADAVCNAPCPHFALPPPTAPAYPPIRRLASARCWAAGWPIGWAARLPCCWQMCCLLWDQQPWLPRRSIGRSSQVGRGVRLLLRYPGKAAGPAPPSCCRVTTPLFAAAGRALVGLGVGLASVTVPVYSEWLPVCACDIKHLRLCSTGVCSRATCGALRQHLAPHRSPPLLAFACLQLPSAPHLHGGPAW